MKSLYHSLKATESVTTARNDCALNHHSLLQYFFSYNLSIVRVRSFNHIGPRQSADFVVSSFAKKIAEIEKGKKEPVLAVGNLEAKRDLTDVRDIVKAYSLIAKKGKIGDAYNLGSGVSYKIADILEWLLSFSKKKIKVVSDPSLFRPVDTPELLCDNRKIRKAIDWKPTISIAETLKDTLDYWRNIV
ncbi:MAG: GDP-mannose 4,6-dehydratase [Candidatus Levybacteria bacterium]|nr:GDP-mannose 4,6-dehydratase [Candidatus Levybacteria bacterium]